VAKLRPRLGYDTPILLIGFEKGIKSDLSQGYHDANVP
jgi:hypothetical protein